MHGDPDSQGRHIQITVHIIKFILGWGATLIWASSTEARWSLLSVQMQPVEAGGEMVSGMLQTQKTLFIVMAVPIVASAAGENCLSCGIDCVSGTVPHGSYVL